MTAGVDFNQLVDRHFGIDGGGFQALMPEPLLDVTDVGPALSHASGCPNTLSYGIGAIRTD